MGINPLRQVINDPFVMLTVLLLTPVSCWWLAKVRFSTSLNRGLAVLAVGQYAFFSTFVFPWVVFTVHLRWFPLLAWLAASAAALHHPPVPEPTSGKSPGHRNMLIAFTAGLLLFNAGVIKGLLPPRGGIELAFPLQGGDFYILQGGSSNWLNHHYSQDSDARYALDIVQMDAFGRRANGLLPDSMDKYRIYHAWVYSPCSGEVVKIIDGWQDAPLFSRDADVQGGNQIVIDCSGKLVWLEHLAKDSLQVVIGQAVEVGDLLARVGSSGASSEPHLHIHSQADAGGKGGGPLPIIFAGRYLVRNTVFRVPGE